MRFSSTMIDRHRSVVAGAIALACLSSLLLLAGCASPREDYTAGQGDTCAVHGLRMTKTVVPIAYGLIVLDKTNRARWAASTNAFPNAQDWVAGGCCPGPARKALIYTCPECKKLRARWEANYGK